MKPELTVMQFQIIFNPTSAAELAKMPRELQLHILGEFRGLPQEVLKSERHHFGELERAGKTLRNLRWFEVVETRGHIENGAVAHWQVTIKAGFTLDD